MVSLIPDINFKISLASLKLISIVLANCQINKRNDLLVLNLVEKFADSKQVVRDATLECCTLAISALKPETFILQAIKSL